MNRIVKIILTVFFICLGVFASAQDYIVKSFEMIPDDIDARVNSRVGNNGRKCALLKVYVQDGINHANGSVVGDIETKGMEKRIYLAHDSKQVELVFENHFPLRIKFDDYNIPVVTEQTVYVLKLIEDGGQALQNEVNNSGNGVGRDFVETAAGLNMKMVWVEGGEFMMGGTSEQGSDAESDEKPVRRVKLNSYYIGECEVTQSQWKKVMGTTLDQQASMVEYAQDAGEGPDNPMYWVNWDEAQAFCLKLSRMTGRTYCLPTEAQWEYAARGGKKAEGTKYSGHWSIDAVAWYDDNSNSTQPVKSKRANSLGLYDMSGNVWEWCSDWYGEYNVNDTINPTGPPRGLLMEDWRRVRRGGSWYSYNRGWRVSDREYCSPDFRGSEVGFRVALIP